MPFHLHPRLAAGGHILGRIAGCTLLLKDNSLFPWLILVPEVVGIEDLHQLPPDRYLEVADAIRRTSEFLSHHFKPEKLNIACIGNQVRQMHIHLIARSTTDPAWPDPVWGFPRKVPYTPAEIAAITGAARAHLSLAPG